MFNNTFLVPHHAARLMLFGAPYRNKSVTFPESTNATVFEHLQTFSIEFHAIVSPREKQNILAFGLSPTTLFFREEATKSINFISPKHAKRTLQ